jgi:hypothetical protein
LQNLPAVVEFENKRRDELETAMMNMGENFHNPHPSAALQKVFTGNLNNPFVVK